MTSSGKQGPAGWVLLAREHQRGWARQQTADAVTEIVLTGRLRKGLQLVFPALARDAARLAGGVTSKRRREFHV